MRGELMGCFIDEGNGFIAFYCIALCVVTSDCGQAAIIYSLGRQICDIMTVIKQAQIYLFTWLFVVEFNCWGA